MIYTYSGDNNSSWSFTDKAPVKISINNENPKEIKLKWDSPYSGQFELSYGDCTKTIVVESLF
jgi:hypothetical protein